MSSLGQRTLVARALCILALSLFCLTSEVARAQSTESLDAQAHRLYDEGEAHFDAGRFAEAAEAFRHAYVLSPRFELLFNIGQAEMQAGRRPQALEALEGFLRQAPEDDARRGVVEERVRVLRALGVTASAGTVVDAPSSTSAPSSSAGPAPWIVVGVGAAVLVAGAVLLGVGAADHAQVTGVAEGAMWRDVSDAAYRAVPEMATGGALLGVGLVTAVVGLAWGVSSPSTDTEVAIGPGSITLRGTF